MRDTLLSAIWYRIISHPAFLLVAGILTTGLCVAAAGSVLQKLAPQPGQTSLINLIGSCVLAGASVVGYSAFVRFIERKPLADFALKGAGLEWLYGAILGGGAMTLVVGVIAALGGYRITGYNPFASVIIDVVAVAIVSGILEEVLFRGLLFRLLEQWLGSISALILSALLFGLLHLGNPGASWLAAFAIALEAGILLGAVYMLTRRLWAVIGLHMAWNSVQGGVFGIKVSGTDLPGLIISESPGSHWLTGGAFGAEASVPAIIICTTIGLCCMFVAYHKGHVVSPSWHRFKTGTTPTQLWYDPPKSIP